MSNNQDFITHKDFIIRRMGVHNENINIAFISPLDKRSTPVDHNFNIFATDEIRSSDKINFIDVLMNFYLGTDRYDEYSFSFINEHMFFNLIIANMDFGKYMLYMRMLDTSDFNNMKQAVKKFITREELLQLIGKFIPSE